MNLRNLYNNFIYKICEGSYSEADSLLGKILTEKVKRKIEKAVDVEKAKDEKKSPKPFGAKKKSSTKKK